MAPGDAREGKWRGNWRMEWVASTLHTTSEHGVSSITTADAHTSAASIRLNWRPRRFKWTRPFRRKAKSDFCACSITFQTQSTNRRCVTYQKSKDLLGMRFFSFPRRPIWLWDPSNFLYSGCWFFLRLKRPGRALHQYLPSSAEDNNEWSYTYIPPICLHRIDRDNFTYTLFFIPITKWITRISNFKLYTEWTATNKFFFCQFIITFTIWINI
jgi:hypothetical protein